MHARNTKSTPNPSLLSQVEIWHASLRLKEGAAAAASLDQGPWPVVASSLILSIVTVAQVLVCGVMQAGFGYVGMKIFEERRSSLPDGSALASMLEMSIGNQATWAEFGLALVLALGAASWLAAKAAGERPCGWTAARFALHAATPFILASPSLMLLGFMPGTQWLWGLGTGLTLLALLVGAGVISGWLAANRWPRLSGGRWLAAMGALQVVGLIAFATLIERFGPDFPTWIW